jgi:phosphoserine phosphatase RsbU/P
MNRTKFLLAAGAVLLISLLIVILLYRDTHPLGGILTDTDASDVKIKSASMLDELEIDVEGLSPKVELKSNARLIRQTQVKFGFKKGNELMRSGLPGYYWETEWKSGGMLTFSSNGESASTDQDTKVRFRFDTKGNLLHFNRDVIDTIVTSKLTRDEAEQLSQNFILNYGKGESFQHDTLKRKITDTLQSISFNIGSGGRVEFKNEKKIEQDKRTDYEFYYTGRDEILNNDIILTVTISGDIVSGFDTEYVVPEGEYSSESFKIYEAVTVILFYVIIFIIIAVLGFRRIRAFEIGFRTAIIMGLITALFFAVEIYLSLGESIGWEVVIPLLLGPLLYGGGVILIWAVSETVTRETWNEKMISVDLLTKGYFLHSRVGTSFLTGIAGGVLLSALLLILLSAADSIMPLWYTPDENSFFNQFNSPVPALTILTHFVYASIFVAAVFFLFIVSGLRKRFSTVWLIIISSVLWGLVNAKSIYPIYAAAGIELLIGLVLILIFYRYDLLSALVAVAIYNLVLSSGVLIYQQDATFLNSGYFIAIVLIIILLFAVVSLFTKDKIKDFQNITPVFVKNITERQRMQRELEIARDVQMSFLPRENPDFNGLDIAGRCYPANEVGGDYYEFVKISDNKAGIVVGDVSGKGTQAAFYMTLTKGFLKAVSKVSESPSEVLSQMNELFFENVERGTFISMIYGMFDNEKKIFRLARAGHNPVIVKRSLEGEVGILSPTGLALGLEKGIIFRKTIKEVEVPISAGEVYVFYTDGFTEAMDRNKAEYGEERLIKYIEKNSGLTAQEILDGIFLEVKKFIGKAYQHDDMTMVVVKVKEMY